MVELIREIFNKLDEDLPKILGELKGFYRDILEIKREHDKESYEGSMYPEEGDPDV